MRPEQKQADRQVVREKRPFDCAHSLSPAFQTRQLESNLNHVRSVIVQVPQLAVVALMSPPEGVLSQNLVLLEICPYTPTLIVR